jgi:invasion protein IalB
MRLNLYPLALLAMFAPGSFALAQEASTMTTQFDNWTLRCQTGPVKDPASHKDIMRKTCDVSATFMAQTKNKQQVPVLAIGIGHPSTDKPTRIAVQTPLGVWLPAELKIQDTSGKELLSLPYTACQPQGCIASADVSERHLQALANAGESAVALFRMQSGQDVKVMLPLKGLSAAYAGMQKELPATSTETGGGSWLGLRNPF